MLEKMSGMSSMKKKDGYREESMAELFQFLNLDEAGNLVSDNKPDPKTCMRFFIFSLLLFSLMCFPDLVVNTVELSTKK